MKQIIKRFVQHLAKVPLFGTVIHICVSMYRLPITQRRIGVIEQNIGDLRTFMLEINHLVQIEHPKRMELISLTTDQISSLIANLADINSRFANLERSVPVALRKIARDSLRIDEDLSGLHGGYGVLSNQLDEIKWSQKK